MGIAKGPVQRASVHNRGPPHSRRFFLWIPLLPHLEWELKLQKIRTVFCRLFLDLFLIRFGDVFSFVCVNATFFLCFVNS